MAIVGSDSVNTKGMEVWNPSEETVSTFHEELPHEKVTLNLSAKFFQPGVGRDSTEVRKISNNNSLIFTFLLLDEVPMYKLFLLIVV